MTEHCLNYIPKLYTQNPKYVHCNFQNVSIFWELECWNIVWPETTLTYPETYESELHCLYSSQRGHLFTRILVKSSFFVKEAFCIDVIKHFSTLYALLQYILWHQCTAKFRNQATLTLQIAHPPEFMILWSISERPSHHVGSNLQIAKIPLPLGLCKLFFSVGINIG